MQHLNKEPIRCIVADDISRHEVLGTVTAATKVQQPFKQLLMQLCFSATLSIRGGLCPCFMVAMFWPKAGI